MTTSNCVYMGIRKYVNEKSRDVGNRFYDGLGDRLVSDVSLKGVGKGLTGVACGVMALGAVEAYQPVSAHAGWAEELAKRVFVDQATRRVTDDVYDGAKGESDSNKNGNSYNVQSKPRIAINRWIDLDNDGKPTTADAFVEIPGNVIPISKYDIQVSLVVGTSGALSDFEIYDASNLGKPFLSLKGWDVPILKKGMQLPKELIIKGQTVSDDLSPIDYDAVGIFKTE